ncbi:MAG: metallophosphoesterase [Antricoccus sp.]
MKLRRVILFGSIIIVVLVLLQALPLTFFVLTPSWVSAVTVIGWVLAALGVVVLPLLMFLGHGRNLDFAAVIADVWLGITWQLFAWAVIGELSVLVMYLVGVNRDFRERVWPLLVLTSVVVLLLYGMVRALAAPPIRRREIVIERLPPTLDGLTIGQLTDTHLSPILGRAWIAKVVDRLNALQPQIVVHTGDLADGDIGRRKAAVDELGRIVAPQGRYFITGNHEYLSDAAHWVAHMRALGWIVLQNSNVVVGAADAQLAIIGINDLTAPGKGPAADRSDIDKAVLGVPSTMAKILLAHQPKQIRDAVHIGADLQLSGHTHGGQMWPFHLLVKLEQGAVHGLSRHGIRTLLYTSRGTGFWGPPFRIFAPPEITLITLRRRSGERA